MPKICRRLRDLAEIAFHEYSILEIAFPAGAEAFSCALCDSDAAPSLAHLAIFPGVRNVRFSIQLSIGMDSYSDDRSGKILAHVLEHLPNVRELQIILDISEYHPLITPFMTSTDFEGAVGSLLREMSNAKGVRHKELSFVYRDAREKPKTVYPYAALLDIVDGIQEWVPSLTVLSLASGEHPTTEIVIQYTDLDNAQSLYSALLSIRTFPHREWLSCTIKVP